jgi:hypothetical protein
MHLFTKNYEKKIILIKLSDATTAPTDRLAKVSLQLPPGENGQAGGITADRDLVKMRFRFSFHESREPTKQASTFVVGCPALVIANATTGTNSERSCNRAFGS